MVRCDCVKYTAAISSALLLLLISKSTSFRLPKDTVPKLYKLNLAPHIDDEKFTFDGSSSIDFEVVHPTDTVIVHSSDLLDIDREYTKVICSNGTVRQPLSQEWDEAVEFLNIMFEDTLPIGEYAIEFKWRGRPDDPPRREGFAQHKQDVDGTLENTIATFFEPRGARTVFPCWDEPGFKAEFLIAVQHKIHHKAISNMPIKEVVPIDDEHVRTIFEKSPPMATYQLSIVVGLLEEMTNEHRNMTFWIQPGKLDHIEFSAQWSPLIVHALENYTGIAYSLPKLDSVFICDYPSNAMEHWGAITYSYDYLHKPGKEHINDDFDIALTLSHEITHQWFGNLVTHEWWDDIWLTEAISQYLSYKMLDDVSSKWQAKSKFAVEIVNTWSFKSAAYDPYNHPIGFMPDKIEGPDEKFGATMYQRGAAVVQILEHILSDDIFQNGIRIYLNKHKFGSVTTNDLWTSLQEAHDKKQLTSRLNIKETMDPWLYQNGHPLLNVTRNDKTGVVTITQSNAIDSNSSATWKIPITFATASRPNFDNTQITHWMDPTTNSLEIHGVDKDDWIILNIQSKDFYQVVYDFENWKRIAAYLNSENYNKIHLHNRAQLIIDIPELDVSNEQLIELTVDVISYLSREVLPFPLKVGIDRVNSYMESCRKTSVYDLCQQFTLHHLKKVINRIGYETHQNDDDLTRLLRFKLLGTLCELGDEKCRNAATVKFFEYVRGGAGPLEWNAYTSDKNQWMYCYGLATANETIWNLVEPHVEIADLLRCSTNSTLITNFLVKIVDGRITKFYDLLVETINSLTCSSENMWDFAFNFYISHIDEIRQYYLRKVSTERTENKIAETLNSFAKSATTLNHEEKLRQFLNGDGSNIKGLEESVKHVSKRLQSVESFRKFFETTLKRKMDSIK